MFVHSRLKVMAAGLALVSGIAGAAENHGRRAHRFPTRSIRSGPTPTRRPPATGSTTNPSGRRAESGRSRAKTVDFGASDAPLEGRTSSQKDGLIQFPTVIRRRGSGRQPVGDQAGRAEADRHRARRYLRWARSPSGTTRPSTELNPGLKLPDQDIGVVRRADGSGTTAHIHQLSVQGERRLEAEDRRGHHGAVAGRPGRQGQRGRLGLRAAPAGVHRLRRVRLRQAEQARARAAQERRGDFRAAERGIRCRPPPLAAGWRDGNFDQPDRA